MIDSTPANGDQLKPESKTVLVVEDEVLIRLVIADSLRDAGFSVIEAANADEAVSLFGSFDEISLVFTDIQMPGTLDGIELANFVRSNRPHVAVILTSGAVRPPQSADSFPFVGKPYDPDAIVRRVRTLLDEGA